METIRKIRQAYHRDGKKIREITRLFNLSRNTVKKIIRSGITDQTYVRTAQHRPKLGPFTERLTEWLKEDLSKPVRHRRTAQILFEQLQREGFNGGYDSVRRYTRQWKALQQATEVKAFIPLVFDPGEAFQFDWSYEKIELGGVPLQVKVAQFRLCHSRMPFCIAYTRESLEMVLDAHVRAFEFFGGACRRGIYDNLKTVVTKVLMGKDRVFNRRFQNLASHYLFEPVACTPAAGWEKGQVENQVGLVRQRFFVQKRRFANLEELNIWLEEQCRHHAATQKHPDAKEHTIAEVFADEREHLLKAAVPFDGYQESMTRVSPMSLISFDRNRYSVNASAVGQTVAVRAYADRVVVVRDGEVVAFHRRHLGRDKVIYDPWHYLLVLQKKPGALRNGAPFKEWNLPEPISEVRKILKANPDGDRQFVGILSVIPHYGEDAVAEACTRAIADKTVSRDVILNLLSRTNEEAPPQQCQPSPQLPLITCIPVVDCHRYDRLLSGGGYGTA